MLTCTECFVRLFHYITLNGTSYHAGIVINAPNNTEILSVKLKITHCFIKRIRVCNACITEFRILILLGDEGIPLFRLCLEVIPFCFISERSFIPIYQSRQSIWALESHLVSELVHWTPSICHRQLHNTQSEYPQIGLLYTRINSVN